MVAESWKAYYRLTQDLPPAPRLRKFLDTLPQQARVLDFGCGTGRFALAFLRDRPDLTVDLLDMHLEAALPELEGHPGIGERWQQDFAQWQPPSARYDGIWANASLFFLSRQHLPATLSALHTALKPGGMLFFTHVEEGPEAQAMRFTGMQEAALRALLAESGFQVTDFARRADMKYGKEGLLVPTFIFYARKICV